jgi:hypothetical protein
MSSSRSSRSLSARPSSSHADISSEHVLAALALGVGPALGDDLRDPRVDGVEAGEERPRRIQAAAAEHQRREEQQRRGLRVHHRRRRQPEALDRGRIRHPEHDPADDAERDPLHDGSHRDRPARRQRLELVVRERLDLLRPARHVVAVERGQQALALAHVGRAGGEDHRVAADDRLDQRRRVAAGRRSRSVSTASISAGAVATTKAW